MAQHRSWTSCHGIRGQPRLDRHPRPGEPGPSTAAAARVAPSGSGSGTGGAAGPWLGGDGWTPCHATRSHLCPLAHCPCIAGKSCCWGHRHPNISPFLSPAWLVPPIPLQHRRGSSLVPGSRQRQPGGTAEPGEWGCTQERHRTRGTGARRSRRVPGQREERTDANSHGIILAVVKHPLSVRRAPAFITPPNC